MPNKIMLAIAFVLITCVERTGASTNTPGPCGAPQFRELDFWIGDWDVRNPAGRVEGRDRVTREYGGCVLQEHFQSNDRSSYGSSFAFYNALQSRWHYTWVDNIGAFELLDGHRVGRSMVLYGWHDGRVHKHLVDKITWTPLLHRVRQLWQVSLDGGHVWQRVTDVYYWPRK